MSRDFPSRCRNVFACYVIDLLLTANDIDAIQVQNLREKNLPITRLDRPNSLVELKQCVFFAVNLDISVVKLHNSLITKPAGLPTRY